MQQCRRRGACGAGGVWADFKEASAELAVRLRAEVGVAGWRCLFATFSVWHGAAALPACAMSEDSCAHSSCDVRSLAELVSGGAGGVGSSHVLGATGQWTSDTVSAAAGDSWAA